MNPFVIGIAGGSCSGKSTFAYLLQDAVQEGGSGCITIALDAFYTRDLERGPTVALSDGTTMFDFNHPDAIDAEAAVTAIQGAGHAVVIVEGLFTLAIEPIRNLLDGSLFIHLDADLRAIRRLLRDMKGGRASTDPEFIARYYIESARVGHARFVEPSRVFADTVVTGESAAMNQALPEVIRRVLGA